MANLIICSVLVTGSNRGIGLELVKTFLNKRNPPKYVFAACRNPETAQELKSLTSKHSNLVNVKMDVTDKASIEDAYSVVKETLKGRGLNLLINNAGINVYHSADETTSEDMMRVYETNTVGPMLVTQIFAPLLKKAAQENPNEVMSCSKAAVIHTSSSLGSLESTTHLYPTALIEYRCSKTALNMLTRCQAEAYKMYGIIAVAFEPGWVQTDMGGPKAELKLHESVGGMMEVFDTLTEKHNGMFLDYKGLTLPW
ncbi:C-factor-like [Rana temporaria]|uniref:C-factor-like n=1 Tax=Rana temporaria TaxID=8407 RepID=UPI001AAD26D8|nr:C-factor-like [Rana temporaria]XP_040180530.1 C-factor-like [Rana temporaria]